MGAAMYILAEHLNWHWKHWRHRRLAAHVLETPPLVPRDDGVVLLSMIGTAVLLSCLVAIKSVHGRLGRGRVVILDDGTLTAADRAVLAQHLGEPQVIRIADIDTGACPRGNVWERLLCILDLRAKDYVIQVDSDLVAVGPLTEVAEAIEAGRSFTLRGEARAERLDVAAIAAEKGAIDPLSPAVHVQHAAEALLDRVELPGRALHYVRGCAGFAGFAPDGEGRLMAEVISAAMDRAMGRALWERWGSEQIAANFVIANDRDPLLLPYDRYFNQWGVPLLGRAPLPAKARLVHFIGTYRFNGTRYLQATRTAIESLNGADSNDLTALGLIRRRKEPAISIGCAQSPKSLNFGVDGLGTPTYMALTAATDHTVRFSVTENQANRTPSKKRVGWIVGLLRSLTL
jgi:hypothetical protein